MKCKMQNSENSHGILGKGNTSTKPPIFGFHVNFRGCNDIYSMLHESANVSGSIRSCRNFFFQGLLSCKNEWFFKDVSRVGSSSRKVNPHIWFVWFRSTPHPVTVTTRIITFLIGNPYKPSFVTVTGWGVDLMYDVYMQHTVYSLHICGKIIKKKIWYTVTHVAPLRRMSLLLEDQSNLAVLKN